MKPAYTGGMGSSECTGCILLYLDYGHRVSQGSNTRRECRGEGVREQHKERVSW